MRYVVIGVPRSGTSMVMRCLDFGGLPVWRDLARDRHPPHSNPNGYYEPPQGAFTSSKFPRNVPTEHAFKMFLPDVGVLAGAKALFRVAFLRRDPAAILASHERMFGRMLKQRLGSHGLLRSDLTPGGYDRTMRDALRRVTAAGGVESVVELTYEAILDDPEHEFGRLADARWPIDPIAAAVPVDDRLNNYGAA